MRNETALNTDKQGVERRVSASITCQGCKTVFGGQSVSLAPTKVPPYQLGSAIMTCAVCNHEQSVKVQAIGLAVPAGYDLMPRRRLT